MEKNILITAGEPSGDNRAGEMLSELRKLLPETRFWGIGGDSMAEQGVDLVEHISSLSMVGVWEVVKNLSRVKEQFLRISREIKKRKPSLAILVDYPGFNLRLASMLKRQGVPVVYYVIPQVWAWGQHRVNSLRKNVDMAVVLFQFEKEFLEKRGINAVFAGHPLVDRAVSHRSFQAEDGRTTIALLPGSRKNEICGLLPVMLGAADIIMEKMNNVHFVLAQSSNVDAGNYESAISRHPGIPLSRTIDDTFSCLDRSDFAIVASGTATLETAVMGKPLLVTYKASALTYYMYKLFIKIPYLSLVNILAGKEVAPELLQGDATAENLAGKTLEMLRDPDIMARTKDELKKVKESLGEKGASKRAAQAIAGFMLENGI